MKVLLPACFALAVGCLVNGVLAERYHQQLGRGAKLETSEQALRAQGATDISWLAVCTINGQQCTAVMDGTNILIVPGIPTVTLPPISDRRPNKHL